MNKVQERVRRHDAGDRASRCPRPSRRPASAAPAARERRPRRPASGALPPDAGVAYSHQSLVFVSAARLLPGPFPCTKGAELQ